jgi:hypothetical protein
VTVHDKNSASDRLRYFWGASYRHALHLFCSDLLKLNVQMRESLSEISPLESKPKSHRHTISNPNPMYCSQLTMKHHCLTQVIHQVTQNQSIE